MAQLDYVSDLLPTNEEMRREFGYMAETPCQLQVVHDKLYAWLRAPGVKALSGITRWLIYDEIMPGVWSCPAVLADEQSADPQPKPVMPSLNVDKHVIRTSIKHCLKRAKMGDVASSGNFWTMVVDLVGVFDKIGSLDSDGLMRLAKFNTFLRTSHRLRGPELRMFGVHDKTVNFVSWLNPMKSPGTKSVITDLHDHSGISVSFSRGELYYLTESLAVSDGFNRARVGLSHGRIGSAVFDLERLLPFEKGNELEWWDMTNPRAVEEIDSIMFAFGRIDRRIEDA